MKKIALLLLLLVISLPLGLKAQEVANLQGCVSDAERGLPLPNCHVFLWGTIYSAITDERGRFYFFNLPADEYDLLVTHIGYNDAEITNIFVSPQISTPIELLLTPRPIIMPEVTVDFDQEPKEGSFSGGRIISRETLRRTNVSDIARVLEIEGVATIVTDGNPGGSQKVSIRGSNSDQVLVLLDGQPLNNPADGTADLAKISLNEVQRIEVYPQSPSSLGAQAIGGVINIITLKPGEDQFSVEATASEYGEKRGSILVGQTVFGRPFLAAFEHRESTGEYSYTIVSDDGLDLFTRNVGQTFNRTGADYRRDYFSLRFIPIAPLSLGYRRTILFRHNPDYLPVVPLEHESSTRDEEQEFTFSVREGAAWFQPEVRCKVENYWQRTKTDFGSDYPLLYSETDLKGEAYLADVRWHRKGLDWQELHFGGGIDFERLWSDNLQNGYAERLHQFGYWQSQGNPIEGRPTPVDIGLFSGVRMDAYEDQELFIHPRLGLQFSGGERIKWSLRGEVAGEYKLPSFNALFWQEDLQAAGNPDLKPERSQNREISADIRWDMFTFNITGFDRQVWDLIYWRLNFDNRWKPLNLSRARIYGTATSLRVETRQSPWQSQLSLSCQWMKSVNLTGEPNTDGKMLPYRPEFTSTLSFVQRFYTLQFDASSRWISRRYTNEANTKSLVPYHVWDAGLSRHFNIGSPIMMLSLRLEARNLFNEEYRIVDTAPTPLRELWISVRVERE